MRPVKEITGEQVKDLITKFFYRDNHLCFQILLHTTTNETISYGVYADYSKYKEDFNSLQDARSNNHVIDLQNNDNDLGLSTTKVA